MAAKADSRKAAAPAKRKRPKLAAVPAAAGAADDAKFDRLIYERVRLGIMSALAVREELTFAELKALFDVSDGNLERARAQARGSGLPDLHEVVRGSSAALGLSHHGARPQRAASLPRPCRGGDQGDAARRKKICRITLQHRVLSNAHRNHHGRQRPLGARAALAAHGRPSCRRRRGQHGRRSGGATSASAR